MNVREVEIPVPGRLELRCALERILGRNHLGGVPDRLASAAQSKGKTIRRVSQQIYSMLQENPDLVAIRQLDSDDEDGKSLEELLADLDAMIGLDAVKSRVREILRSVQGTSEDAPVGVYHFFFLGNPGTGKTVVARLFGEILSAAGIRNSRKFVEVTYEDVVSSFNPGDTAEKMSQKIRDAMGGVLFIDEAYMLAENEWGKQALGSLLTRMENDAQSLTVILAMYPECLQQFLSTNPGFQSRVPFTINFPDYNSSEMLRIFRQMAADAHLNVPVESCRKLVRYFDWFNMRGGMDNGRGVRNHFQAAQTNFQQIPRPDRTLTPDLIPDPPQFKESEALKLIENFEKEFLGIPRVKEFLKKSFIRQRAFSLTGAKTLSVHNCLFLGNPGTGKTTAAQKMGTLFGAMGMISERNRFVPIGKGDLINNKEGSPAAILKKKFDEARGGVLFIDEAYELANDRTGEEVVNEIVRLTLLPRYRNLVVIMAGYHDEMQKLLKVNSGLSRRFPESVHFDNFSPDDLVKVFFQLMQKDPVESEGVRRARSISPAEKEAFEKRLRAIFKRLSHQRNFGNAAAVKKFYDDVIVRQGMRSFNAADSDLAEFRVSDLVDHAHSSESVDDILDEMDCEFIGLDPVKRHIRKLAKLTQLQHMKQDRMPGADHVQFHNMMFVGNQGTGKTTIARYMSRVLAALGLIEDANRFVDMQASDLKGGYVGHTERNVRELFENRQGHVVLLDEAYSLAGGNEREPDQYGQAALNALVGGITDPRNASIIFIFAGYPEPMKRFVAANPGMASRIPHLIEFPDYSAEDCVAILKRRAEREGYRFEESEQLDELLMKHFLHLRQGPAFGNARTVGSVWVSLELIFSDRTGVLTQNLMPEEYVITLEDVDALVASSH